jgi:restriction system protein
MEGNIYSIILLIIICLIYYFNKQNNKFKKEFAEKKMIETLEKAKEIIVKNKEQLAIQRKKSVYIDAYGKENITNWLEKEIPYFIKQHIYPKFNIEEQNFIRNQLNEIFPFIDQESQKFILKNYGYSSSMSGLEFEIFCSEKLKSEGWKIKTTKSTGDQGVDLIIEKGKRTIGVQCKKYSKPIGNKSVQEIKAGINFYNLKEGIVLGNNTFTKSAIELGNINNIKLIHYLDTKTI